MDKSREKEVFTILRLRCRSCSWTRIHKIPPSSPIIEYLSRIW